MTDCFYVGGEDPSKMFGKSDPLWTFENLKAYFICCRQKSTIMGKEASQVLSKYYQGQRQKEDMSKSRATVRLLQSLIRQGQIYFLDEILLIFDLYFLETQLFNLSVR